MIPLPYVQLMAAGELEAAQQVVTAAEMLATEQVAPAPRLRLIAAAECLTECL